MTVTPVVQRVLKEVAEMSTAAKLIDESCNLINAHNVSTCYLVMFLENLAEAGEVEGLIVLQ